MNSYSMHVCITTHVMESSCKYINTEHLGQVFSGYDDDKSHWKERPHLDRFYFQKSFVLYPSCILEVIVIYNKCFLCLRKHQRKTK